MNTVDEGLCPCGSQTNYLSCCHPFLNGKHFPKTAETLMRSRYTAYTMANIDYIKETMCGKALNGFNDIEAKRWAKKVYWIKLNVINSVIESPSRSHVEFEAIFVEGTKLKLRHEKSEFIFRNGRWYYIDGLHLPPSLPEKIISRNTNCPCNSQRKFKNCHGMAVK